MDKKYFLHDSSKSIFRSPFGAVPVNTEVKLRFQSFASFPLTQVKLRLWINNSESFIPMEKTESSSGNSIYTATIKTPEKPCLIWYYFIINNKGDIYYYGKNDFGKHHPLAYQITVHREDAVTPDWFKNSIMYQIYVDRYYNGNEEDEIQNPKQTSLIHGNWYDTPVYLRRKDDSIMRWDFFGGNLKGVIKKLPYLKELGIDVIYFNPIFEAPSNHKYDTGDYKKIDPMYGDNQLFEELCQEAKKMGISVFLDGVFSHTGSDSIYFNKKGSYQSLGAYQSKESPYYNWYRFEDYPEKYESWWGIDDLPNVNELEPSYMDFIIYNEDSVIKKWIKAGAKGWRLDVVDELPDEFIKGIWKTMKDVDPESILIGEVWEDASNKKSYDHLREYMYGQELDSVMNYPFRIILINFLLGRKDAAFTNDALMNLCENYPIHYFYSTMNLVGSHDVTRILTVLGEHHFNEKNYTSDPPKPDMDESSRKLGISRLKLITLIQMTFPGVPCIYYGDEAGIEGHKDPYNRRTYPWGRENKEILDWCKKMIKIRKSYESLRTGQWIPIYTVGDVYGYIRKIENNKDVFKKKKENSFFIIVVNRNTNDPKEISIVLNEHFNEGNMVNLIKENESFKVENGILKLRLEPLEGKILKKN